MDVKSYCDTVGGKLIGWKSNLYDVIRALETKGGEDTAAHQAALKKLHNMVDDLNANLGQLANECPADWSPNKRDIDGKIKELETTLSELSGSLGVPETLAWI